MSIPQVTLPEIYAILEALPECGTHCLLGTINNQSECSLLDVACTCTSRVVQATTAGCVAQSCTIPDALRTQNLTNSLCGISSHRGYSSVIINYTFAAIASICVALRFITRITHRNPLWLDDYFIFVSIAFAIVFCAFTGVGLDVWAVPQENLPTVFKLVLIGLIVSIIARCFIRVSISLFLMRIFPVSNTRPLIILTLVLNVAITIVFTICDSLQCTPISYFWDAWDGLHEGTCIKQWDMLLVSGCIATALDVFLILLPIRWISQLQFSRSKKIATLGMFAFGVIVAAISIVRVVYLLRVFTDRSNQTRLLTDLAIWAGLEIYIAIICACLPSLRPLLKLAVSFKPKVTRGTQGGGSWPSGSAGQRIIRSGKMRLPSDDSQYPETGKGGSRSPNIRLTRTVQQQYEERPHSQFETNFTRATINDVELSDQPQVTPRGGSWT